MLRLSKSATIILFIVLLLYLVIVATPFGVLFLNSFKSMREIYLKPFAITESFGFDNYIQAWKKAELGSAYLNSIVVSVASIGGVLLFSSMLAFMISRYRFKFRRLLYIYIITGLALPARLAVIPIYVTLNQLNLTDTRIGLIMVYIATGTAFATFIIKGFMDSIPMEIEESARMDGATPWIIYWKIALPLTKP
ncbi:MAG: carbohydrate ABC transporter permease, partial [Candidatus Moranbacteria bacterium]|nr:carbohydrate ABC transporter permease [Candidatus Moranbacteria bacterium]